MMETPAVLPWAVFLAILYFTYAIGVGTVLAWVVALVAVYISSVMYKTKMANSLAKKLYGPSAELITGNDYMWRMDSLYNNLNVNSYYIVEGRLSGEEVAELYRREVLCSPLNHRLKQRVVMVKGLPFWADDKDFDINNHIFEVNPHFAPKDMEGLLDMLAHSYSQPFPVDRPMWEVEVIPDFQGSTKTAVVSRFHHVIGDGVAMVTLWLNLLRRIEDGTKLIPTLSTKKVMQKPRPVSWAWLGLQIALMGPLLVLDVLLGKADCNPMHTHELSGKRQVALSKQFELADVKAISKHFGATVNDTAMGIVGAAINRYFSELGHSEKIIHLYVPVNLRISSQPAKLENKFSPSFARLPVHTPDPSESIKVASGMFKNLKSSVNPMVMYLMATWLGSRFCPRWFGHFFLDYVANKTTAVITNVPGPQEKMLYAGHVMDDVSFWVPARGSIGVGISVLSYGGTLQVGLTTDVLSMKNPRELIEKVDDVFAEVNQLVKATSSVVQSPVAEGSN